MITCKGKETRILILKNTDTERGFWISSIVVSENTQIGKKGLNKYDNMYI